MATWVQYLILEQHCDPNIRNKGGEAPDGYIDLIDYFITELGCDPAIPDSWSLYTVQAQMLSSIITVIMTQTVEIIGHHCMLNGYIDLIDYFIRARL